ncbi:MAG TPA: hypothetical protein PK069_08155 [Methanolinea sp.]|nr:hypothetical protein [Methanolinea sp.]
MAKKLILPTISLGSELPIPDTGELAEWVRGQRGRQADLTSFLLEKGLLPQKEAGVGFPCAGGKFYRERMFESISGIKEGYITGELGSIPGFVEDDAARVRSISGGCRVALPAPHLLELTDRYYGDGDESSAALCQQYRRLLRAMRDAGVTGHVLHCSAALPEELETLAGKTVFFFLEELNEETITTLLEYQRAIAVRVDQLPLLLAQREEYEISQVLIMDPDAGDLTVVLSSFDQDQIRVGGYCTEHHLEYWRDLVDSATVSLQ